MVSEVDTRCPHNWSASRDFLRRCYSDPFHPGSYHNSFFEKPCKSLYDKVSWLSAQNFSDYPGKPTAPFWNAASCTAASACPMNRSTQIGTRTAVTAAPARSEERRV